MSDACTCYEAGRDPACPVHGSFAGLPSAALERDLLEVAEGLDALPVPADLFRKAAAELARLREALAQARDLLADERQAGDEYQARIVAARAAAGDEGAA